MNGIHVYVVNLCSLFYLYSPEVEAYNVIGLNNA